MSRVQDFFGPASAVKSSQPPKNYLINEGFSVAQREATVITGSEAFAIDRWYVHAAGQNIEARSYTDPTGGRSLVFNGSPLNSQLDLGQRIEGSTAREFLGKQLSISADIYTQDGRDMEVYLVYPSALNDYTTVTEQHVGTLSTGNQVYLEDSLVTDSITNADVLNGLAIEFRAGGLTDLLDQIGFNWAKLEIGDRATEFVPRSDGEELALCQRYYWSGNAPGNGLGYRAGAGSTTSLGNNVIFHVTMRTIPTITIITPPTYTNCTFTSLVANVDSFVERVSTTTAVYRSYGGVYGADSEIY